MNSPPSSEENNISKSIWVRIEKKRKKTQIPCVWRANAFAQKVKDMVTSFPKMTRREIFIEKNENFHSCEEYIRVVCTCTPPVVLVWCFRFAALRWNIAVTLIIDKEDHQICSISLSESFADLGIISSLNFFG